MNSGSVTLITDKIVRRICYYSIEDRRKIINTWITDFGGNIIYQINPDIDHRCAYDRNGNNIRYVHETPHKRHVAETVEATKIKRPQANYDNIRTYKYE